MLPTLFRNVHRLPIENICARAEVVLYEGRVEWHVWLEENHVGLLGAGEVAQNVPYKFGLRAHRGVPNPWRNGFTFIENTQKVDDVGLTNLV